ncbi:MlaD family protein [Calidifontimicrobium sp. SYSU G02091]|uniref:MlaD family protein n=1 Tax=Calidifontimicrobium sp. SYSU G02091 TaxID=2926421 RepID=UPI001F539CBE|nr:MlaD family protein [Calidifontimicrobium sp. SYSU G02091]MCI1191813.1 MlaD family protein [Calidifontimicrobium sp. SYSU G02091]
MLPAPDSPAPPTPARDARLELKATLLLVALALLLAASVTYLLYARGAFERTQELVLVADDSEGVSVGMDMTFSGFAIGRVRRIALADDGSVRIVVDVPVRDAKWLRESSVFVLVRNLVGGTSLRAYSGVLSDPPLPPGAERRVLVGDATAEIPQLVRDARDLIANLRALTAADAPLAGTLAQAQRFAERLNGPGGALGAVVGDEQQAKRLVSRLEGAVARTDALIARIDGVVARADARVLGDGGVLADVQAGVVELRALLADARTSVEKVNAVLDETKGIAGNVRAATVDLDALRAEVEATLRRIDHLIGEVNRRWPFARDTEVKLP